jgi:hypothetical protein
LMSRFLHPDLLQTAVSAFEHDIVTVCLHGRDLVTRVLQVTVVGSSRCQLGVRRDAGCTYQRSCTV